jgi:hypothetical protein
MPFRRRCFDRLAGHARALHRDLQVDRDRGIGRVSRVEQDSTEVAAGRATNSDECGDRRCGATEGRTH